MPIKFNDVEVLAIVPAHRTIHFAIHYHGKFVLTPEVRNNVENALQNKFRYLLAEGFLEDFPLNTVWYPRTAILEKR